MLILDAFFRFTGIGMLLLLSLLIFRKSPLTNSALFLLLSALSVMALFLGLTPEYIKLPLPFKFIVRIMDVPHLLFIWLFALSLFDKDFKFSITHIFILVTYSLSILVVRFSQFDILPTIPSWWFVLVSLASIALMAHLMIVTLTGRKDDLNEKRRSFRHFFVIIIAFITILSGVAEVLLIKDNLELLATVKIMIIWPAILLICTWLMEINSDVLIFNVQENTLELSNKKHIHLIEELKNVMEVEQVFRNNKLTLDDLASYLNSTPHKLRLVINKNLGFDNFSTYINSYRIRAVKDSMKNPKFKSDSILSIAIDSGFNSLSPFNRAFKISEGETPSAYKKKINHSDTPKNT